MELKRTKQREDGKRADRTHATVFFFFFFLKAVVCSSLLRDEHDQRDVDGVDRTPALLLSGRSPQLRALYS